MDRVVARPRLLFLAQTLPYPPNSGVATRTYHVLRMLSRSYDVTALCFYRAKAHPTTDSVAESLRVLRRLGRVEAFAIPQEHSRPRLLRDHLRSALTGTAYTRFTYESAPFRRRLRELVRSERFDLVHVDSLDLCAYLPELRDQRIVCVHHNVESRLLERRAAAEPSSWRRAYLAMQAKWLRREERHWLPRVALNVAVSDADRAELQTIAPEARFLVVPNGVDVDEFQPAMGAVDGIAYIGGTEWGPNLDALDFFCHDILPHLRESGHAPPVRWVGRSTAAERKLYGERHGVELTGFVDDIRPFVAPAACTIVPLRVGGGTRLKITTAWAMGKAVVSTSVGCEGLAAVDGGNILIRDTPEEFALALRSLLVDSRLRSRLERGARETAERVYSWEVIGGAMMRHYADLVADGQR